MKWKETCAAEKSAASRLPARYRLLHGTCGKEIEARIADCDNTAPFQRSAAFRGGRASARTGRSSSVGRRRRDSRASCRNLDRDARCLPAPGAGRGLSTTN